VVTRHYARAKDHEDIEERDRNLNKDGRLTPHKAKMLRARELVSMQFESWPTRDAIKVLVDELGDLIARSNARNIDKLVEKTQRELMKSVKWSVDFWAEIEREMEEEERARSEQRRGDPNTQPNARGDS
jgi:hypothetical protein